MNVLSLFDGMSCGQIALNRAGIKYDNYYASEIKQHAIKVTQHNYPNTIQLGDVTKIKAEDLPKIDLLIGGSPCQDFSQANKERKGLNGEKSSLFFEYVRLLQELKPKYFMLENVVMDDYNYQFISETLGTYPVDINSDLVSAQLRQRSYWTNIGAERFDLFENRICAIPQPKNRFITLQSILENGYVEKEKHTCLNTRSGGDRSIKSLKLRYETTGMITAIFDNQTYIFNENTRMVSQIEMEKLQTVPVGYTSILNKSKAGDLLGDGWTVEVIAHIFSFLK
jgi:DNA (cytosine-5)-methyltransferase 3A